MIGGGGNKDGDEETCIAEDHIYFISIDLGSNIVGVEEDEEEEIKFPTTPFLIIYAGLFFLLGLWTIHVCKIAYFIFICVQPGLEVRGLQDFWAHRFSPQLVGP